ncbi:MAG: pyruvate, phosphate dikinase [Dehalococcoidia bacterium]|nr:pyruvate, phosphate dikinase [Dehalococcoidia bacterium]
MTVSQTTRWVYLFDEGDPLRRDLLGGKGSGVAAMSQAGIPVPPGFTITTEACNAYNDADHQFPPGMWEQALEALAGVERRTGKGFGDPENPLLVSVRSGARFSMPGMMDTVLNLGLNSSTLQGLSRLTGDPRFAWDSYRRFIHMFGRIVLGLENSPFEHAFENAKVRAGAHHDTDLDAQTLMEVAGEFKAIVQKATGQPFPEEPLEQLRHAIAAVFDSWMGKRAVDYRNFEKIPHDLGTAVNVQAMVFGNLGQDSGTGVAFTRNPSTGDKTLFGEFLLNAQGEDVVAGVRTPLPLTELARVMPTAYAQFADIAARLERTYRDVQDMEFTVERGTLWMLQTRSAKRTARAAVNTAVAMAQEGVISREEAVQRVDPDQVVQLLLPRFDPQDLEAAQKAGRLLGQGIAASPGAAVGRVYFDPDVAERQAKAGELVILARPETSPDDVHGLIAAQGVLTSRGGATSHAAVVARGMGRPAVVGAEDIHIDPEAGQMRANGRVISAGDWLSLDGGTGKVYLGQVTAIPPRFSEEGDLRELLSWADEFRRLGVLANADTPQDAQQAREFGAEGIGLCRTEHMFFQLDRLPIVRQMILNAGAARDGDATARAKYQEALDRLLSMQRTDFIGVLRAMAGFPVIIRLIDPPLHEFLPSYDELLVSVTRMEAQGASGADMQEQRALLQRVAQLREANPMLGLRGCRLSILYPEITEMQVRAILEAAVALAREGVTSYPKIMIPLISHVNELARVRATLEPVARAVLQEAGVDIAYRFGTMIETPRAALQAGRIAELAEFFSFGTNDLTQMTFGFSRDDAEAKFLDTYVSEGILPDNPFQVLDQDGVGQLLRLGTQQGRATRPDLDVGVCGEHGGEPNSIAFCHEIGLDYVSCSPFRVPVARLAAAQAALAHAAAERDH